jgi:hypothetical protein
MLTEEKLLHQPVRVSLSFDPSILIAERKGIRCVLSRSKRRTRSTGLPPISSTRLTGTSMPDFSATASHTPCFLCHHPCWETSLRPGQRRFQQAVVAQACGAALQGEQPIMQGERIALVDPDRFLHLART